MASEQLKIRLGATRARLMQAVAGVSEQQFKRRPPASEADPEPWCIAEVLAHLLGDEQLWADRIRLALDGDGARIDPSPPEANTARIAAARQLPVPQLIHGLLAARRLLELRLAEVDTIEGGLDRHLEHSARGPISVRWMVEKVIEHEAEHADQIESIRAHLGVPVAAGETP
jgi:hypothetical protein